MNEAHVQNLLQFRRENAPNSVRLRIFPVNDRANWIFIRELLPGIFLRLLQAQRNAALIGLHIQHNCFDFVAGFHNFVRMLQFLRPSHFTDVHKAFDAGRDLDERSVVGDADDFRLLHARRQ